mgnify:CR=1 FL=1
MTAARYSPPRHLDPWLTSAAIALAALGFFACSGSERQVAEKPIIVLFGFLGLHHSIQLLAGLGDHFWVLLVQGRHRKIPAVEAEGIVDDMQNMQSRVEFAGQGDAGAQHLDTTFGGTADNEDIVESFHN